MVDTVYGVNAVSGAPAFSGKQYRQANSPAFAGATAARPLGGRTGVRPGTSTATVTASSTVWTCGPFAGVADVETAAEASLYPFAFDANATGAVTAAHATLARIDIIYVQVDDPAESDGSSVPAVTRKYLAGTASGSPVAPNPPVSRAFTVAQINVPASGGGSPTVTWVAPYAAGAGGVIPFLTYAQLVAVSSYPAGTYADVFADSTATNNGQYRYSGSVWVYVGDRTADIVTFGANWSATPGAGHKPRVHQVGQQVFLMGAVTIASGGSGTNILTIPAAFQPPTTATRFIGATNTSGGQFTTLALSAGVLQIASSYGNASLAVGNVLPIVSSWFMD